MNDDITKMMKAPGPKEEWFNADGSVTLLKAISMSDGKVGVAWLPAFSKLFGEDELQKISRYLSEITVEAIRRFGEKN